ncbi:hypothetical protein BD414DRAFT_492738 [Trametes punicea]|nr:hypothetical protein BD414DRAFT_492738 [Trametes punicea]
MKYVARVFDPSENKVPEGIQASPFGQLPACTATLELMTETSAGDSREARDGVRTSVHRVF